MNGSPGKRSVVIDDHICGLPGVGFGGYVAGLLATELGVLPRSTSSARLRSGLNSVLSTNWQVKSHCSMVSMCSR